MRSDIGKVVRVVVGKAEEVVNGGVEWREGKDGKGEMYGILDFGRGYLGKTSVNVRILD